MEAYAQALTYGIPFFVILIIIESIAARLMGKKVNRPMDTISSLSSGMTNTLKNFMGLTVIILSYEWMVEHFAMFEIKSTLWLFILAFIGHDFAGYWSHRFNHEINVFWNRHIVHHSSEEFNLACALRQTISTFVSIYFFLYIPMALIGIPAEIVGLVAPIHLFAQFWYHTTLINRMGILEHIIVTPSHHRVHHAINPEYIDKNFSEIFIVWDKWFGTFQAELDDVPPVYGTKKPVKTWNPILINFMHLWQLIQDAWRTSSWWDKLRIWFMPTGWRPEDVREKYPVEVVEDPFARPKYDTPASPLFQAWAWAQLVINNVLMFYMLVKIAEFSIPDLLTYTSFLMVSIFSYTTLMDRHKWALPIELAKTLFGVILMIRMEGWYMLDSFIPGASMMVGGYLALSLVMTVYFTWFENVEEKEPVAEAN
ncbi:MAG: sterol desaturase family protein [Bacteroidota bacterium]